MSHELNSGEILHNVFGFDNPDMLECSVESFSRNHSLMELNIFDSVKKIGYILEFRLVRYYSGPVRWTGANFQMLSWQESVSLISEIDNKLELDEWPEHARQDFGKNQARLYVANILNLTTKVRILAASAYLMKTRY